MSKESRAKGSRLVTVTASHKSFRDLCESYTGLQLEEIASQDKVGLPKYLRIELDDEDGRWFLYQPEEEPPFLVYHPKRGYFPIVKWFPKKKG